MVHNQCSLDSIFLTVRLGLVSPHQAPLQAHKHIKEKHETIKRLN